MLTQSNPGAVVFWPQGVARQISFLASEKLYFEICLFIYFVLDCHAVHRDTLRYLGLYRLLAYEEMKNALGRPERLFENVIFVFVLKMLDFC